MKLKTYQKSIAGGKGILYLSIIIAILIRIIYYFTWPHSEFGAQDSGGVLWRLLAPYFSGRFISMLTATLCLAGISVLSAYINSKNLFIRKKSLFPAALPILLFSCHPAFMLMNGYYVSIILMLYAILNLFSAYQSPKGQIIAVNIFFLLTLSSLFTPFSIAYMLIFWIGLAQMWCFNLRAFLASLFGFLIIYIPIIGYSIVWHDWSVFGQFANSIDNLANLPVFNFNYVDWVALGFAILLSVIIFFRNYMSSYKDKIKVRAYLMFLCLLYTFSLLALMLLNIDTQLSLSVALCAGSFLLAHYFALAEEKSTIYIFYFSVVIYFGITFVSFCM